MVAGRCQLPEGFELDAYTIFQGTPSRLLENGDLIDLGGRTLQVLHTPEHSPGHLCFYEAATGYLFTEDLIYKGTLLAYYPSTDPEAYLASLEKLATLPARGYFRGATPCIFPQKSSPVCGIPSGS